MKRPTSACSHSKYQSTSSTTVTQICLNFGFEAGCLFFSGESMNLLKNAEFSFRTEEWTWKA